VQLTWAEAVQLTWAAVAQLTWAAVARAQATMEVRRLPHPRRRLYHRGGRHHMRSLQ